MTTVILVMMVMMIMIFSPYRHSPHLLHSWEPGCAPQNLQTHDDDDDDDDDCDTDDNDDDGNGKDDENYVNDKDDDDENVKDLVQHSQGWQHSLGHQLWKS